MVLSGLLQTTCQPHISSEPLEVNAGGGCGAPELQIMSFISLHLFNRRPAIVGWVNRGPWMLESTCYEIDLLCKTEGQQNNTKILQPRLCLIKQYQWLKMILKKKLRWRNISKLRALGCFSRCMGQKFQCVRATQCLF